MWKLILKSIFERLGNREMPLLKAHRIILWRNQRIIITLTCYSCLVEHLSYNLLCSEVELEIGIFYNNICIFLWSRKLNWKELAIIKNCTHLSVLQSCISEKVSKITRVKTLSFQKRIQRTSRILPGKQFDFRTAKMYSGRNGW